MAEFLTTHAVAYNIENIILNARQKLILVSPYLQLSKILFERLKDADSRGVKTVLIYGKDELKPSERSQLGTLKNLASYFCENLHAKCYFNEDCMVITSMNMYEFSEKNNREMGILIKKNDDADAFTAAVREAKSILNSSTEEAEKSRASYEQPVTASDREKRPTYKARSKTPSLKNVLRDTLGTIITGRKSDAYCIRCGDRIPFDQYRPLCDDCYVTWAVHENPDYPEHHCHACGKRTKTTKDKPFCRSCYKKSR